MQTLRRLAVVLVLLVAVSSLNCAGTGAARPINLSPAANTAWTQAQAQRILDTIRDIAQDGNAQTPPVFTTAATRTITEWHRVAITTVHTASQGWQQTVIFALSSAVVQLPIRERTAIAPYVQLAGTVLHVVTQP